MATKKKKSSPVGTIIFMVLFAGVVIGLYFLITRNKNNDTKEIPATSSEAEVLIKKDLDWEYPVTPREVLKLYCRITKCLYNDDLTDDQIKKLVSKLRNLYTFELQENNDEDDQIKLLKGDREEYKKDKKTIFQFTIEKSEDISYIDTKAGNTALIEMYFTIQAGANMNRSYEEFSLIQEDSGRWKIAGWKLSEKELAIDEGD